MIRCIACGTESIPAGAAQCPNPDCGEYLPALLRDMLPCGTLLHDGKYEIDCALGRGGFGITYRGRHRALGSLVAIKEFFPVEDAARHTATGGLTVAPAKKQRYDRWLERFSKEGRILAGLDHPGVVRVRDLFRERGTAYLVMDLVKGRTLRREMVAGRMLNARVEAIAGGLVDALEVVHAAGVFHLDVSPENVLVRPDGSVVLIDFGAARQEVALRSSRAYRMEYAAPELLLRGEIGPQTDLYELAMVVHEMLTGDTPERVIGQDWKPEGLEPAWGELLAEALRAQRTARPGSVRGWWNGRRQLTGPASWPGRVGPVVSPPVAPKVFPPPELTDGTSIYQPDRPWTKGWVKVSPGLYRGPMEDGSPAEITFERLSNMYGISINGKPLLSTSPKTAGKPQRWNSVNETILAVNKRLKALR